MNKIKLFVITLIFVLPLFGQYSFDFTCVSDTFQTGTDYFVYYFRLTNTGTLPDTYAFDCRVIDSVPGWFEIYCAGGQCAEPGIILYDYLTPGAVDTGIDISVYTAQNVWGTEKINLLVWSLHNPGLRDSINVYAAMEQGIKESEKLNIRNEELTLDVNPNPFITVLKINFQSSNSKSQTNSNPLSATLLGGRVVDQILNFKLKIYDAMGRLVKQFNDLTNYQFNEIVWAGDDEFGNIVPDGVYIIFVEANGIKSNKIVVKLK